MFLGSFVGRISRCSRSSLRTSVLARSFSSQQGKPLEKPNSMLDLEHKPVLQLYGLAARYANATYVAASKAGQLDKVESELMSLNNSVQTSKQFSSFLENPLISREDKINYVQQLDKLSPVTRNLLVTMAGNAKLKELPHIATTYAKLMKAKRGEVDARIISAQEMTPAQLKQVEKAMQTQVPKGKSVVIESVIDPSIVGGLQVQIGDQFLDLSVKNRIEEIARMPLN